jgi:hypothetical protein
MQAGILEYIQEIHFLKKIQIDISVSKITVISKVEQKGKNKNRHKGFSFRAKKVMKMY